MSPLSIFLVAVAAVLFTVVLLVAAALFTPIALIVDSASGQIRIRWMLSLEYRRPLPGTTGEARLSIFGKPVRTPARKPKTRAPAVRGPEAPPRRKPRRAGRFFWRCLRNSAIRRALTGQLIRLGKAFFGAVELTRWRASVCLEDPAASGILAGALAASGRGGKQRIQVNFHGENSVFIEARLFPHRLGKAVLVFLTCLPYRALLREWRGLGPAEAHQRARRSQRPENQDWTRAQVRRRERFLAIMDKGGSE